MTALPKLRLESVECFERDFKLRLPFRFGVITLTEGTQERDAAGFAAATELLGADISVDAGWDALQGSLVVLNRADGGASTGGSAGLGVGGGLYLAPGGVASADLTAVLANDASTSDDDVFGDLILL